MTRRKSSGDSVGWGSLETGDAATGGCSFAAVDCAEPRHALCTKMQEERRLRRASWFPFDDEDEDREDNDLTE